jgi:hypothetical protein
MKIIKITSFLWMVVAWCNANAQNDKEILNDKLDHSNVRFAPVKSLLHPDTSVTWKYGMVSGLTINQSAVENWSAGGQNAFALSATAGIFVDYFKKKHSWRTLADGSYGLTRIENQVLRKSQDYFEINTKYGYEFKRNWVATGFVEAISQFAPGYNYANDPEGRVPVSRFMAPGFFNQGLGIAYQWNRAGFSARIAPLTARQIVVSHPEIDPAAYGVDSGKTVKSEFGGSVRINLLKQLTENKNFGLSVESRLFLFFNYLQEPQTPFVNWRTKLDLKFFKVLTVGFLFHLMYDPVLRFPDRIDPATGAVLSTQRSVQWLQTLGVGLGYTFVRKR